MQRNHNKYCLIDLVKVLLAHSKDGKEYEFSPQDLDNAALKLGILGNKLSGLINKDKSALILLPQKILHSSAILMDKPRIGFEYNHDTMLIGDVDIYSEAYSKGIRPDQKIKELVVLSGHLTIKIYEQNGTHERTINYPIVRNATVPRYYRTSTASTYN